MSSNMFVDIIKVFIL